MAPKTLRPPDTESQRQALPDACVAVLGSIRARMGDELANLCELQVGDELRAKAATRAKQREAEEITERRRARHSVDHSFTERERPDDGIVEREAMATRPGISRSRRVDRVRDKREAKRTTRETEKLVDRYQRQRKRDSERELAAREELATKVLKEHGIRHHFRPLPKAAFFLAYVAGLDRNGALALAILNAINMPRARMAAVLEAAYRPLLYQPKRNVVTGGREWQTAFEVEAQMHVLRKEDHAHAIRVIQCAIFLWVSKSRVRASGHTYIVRGFGRGLFESICQCGKDALFGHDNGRPGAMVALRAAGFVKYWQPWADETAAVDRGPSGHAYNQFWFAASPEERQLSEMHARIASVGRLPLAARLVADAPAAVPRLLAPRAPPVLVEIDERDIPF